MLDTYRAQKLFPLLCWLLFFSVCFGAIVAVGMSAREMREQNVR